MESSNCIIFNYDPIKDPKYMSVAMQRYFKNRLYSELQDLLEKDPQFSSTIQEDSAKEPDFVDQSATEGLRFNYFVYHEHELHHRHEIEAALQRLENGSYGYCAATGRAIGVQRMLAAPYAMYCIDVQAARETHQHRRWA
jgi:DnaK suppressor protein